MVTTTNYRKAFQKLLRCFYLINFYFDISGIFLLLSFYSICIFTLQKIGVIIYCFNFIISRTGTLPLFWLLSKYCFNPRSMTYLSTSSLSKCRSPSDIFVFANCFGPFLFLSLTMLLLLSLVEFIIFHRCSSSFVICCRSSPRGTQSQYPVPYRSITSGLGGGWEGKSKMTPP